MPLHFVKDRAKTLGAVYELSSGRKVYMAFRDHEHIYQGDPELDPKDGILKPGRRSGIAINEATLTEMRLENVEDFAVWVRDTGDIYLARRTDWLTAAVSYPIDYSRKTGAKGQKGSQQRVLRFNNVDDTANFKTLTGTHVIGRTTRRTH